MSDPDQIRADIERTRAELSDDVNALTEKVTPSRIVARRVDRTKSRFGSIRDRVMGSASDTAGSARGMRERVMGSASDTASGMGDRVSSATSGVGDRVS